MEIKGYHVIIFDSNGKQISSIAIVTDGSIVSASCNEDGQSVLFENLMVTTGEE